MASKGLAPIAWDEEEEVRKRWLGRTVGNCEVEAVVGAGAMGVVFRGRHVLLDKPVAIKVLPRRVAKAGAGHIERLLKEARAAGALEHPGIVQVHDISVTDDGDYYIVMQLVEGADLARLLSERGPLPFNLVVNIGLQATDALLYLHERHFIHRDLKPSNIFINREGQVKLGDLGLVKSLGEPGKSDASLIVGTPEYMAPEQAKGTEYTTPASDVYALGGVLYFMLAGRPPFMAESGAEVLIKHATEPPAPLAHFRPDVPRLLERLVEAMLEKLPAARPELPTVANTLRRLEGKEDAAATPFIEYSLEEEHLAATAFLVRHGAAAGYLGISEVEEALRVQAELAVHGTKTSLPRILLDEGLLGEAALEAIAAEYVRSQPQAQSDALAALVAQGKIPAGLLDKAGAAAAAADARPPLDRLLSERALDTAAYKRYERLVRNHLRRDLRRRLLASLPITPKEQASLLERLETAEATDASALSLAVSGDLISEDTARVAAGLLFKQIARESKPAALASSMATVDEPVAEAAAPLVSLDEFRLEDAPLCIKCGGELDDKGRCPRCLAAPQPPPAPRQQPAASRPAPPYPRRERSGKGRWGILTDDPNDASGYTLDDLARLIAAGSLNGNSTVRGPATRGEWVFARRAPGLARLLGCCPHCLAAVPQKAAECPRCGRPLDTPLQAAAKPRRSRLEALRDWLGL